MHYIWPVCNLPIPLSSVAHWENTAVNWAIDNRRKTSMLALERNTRKKGLIQLTVCNFYLEKKSNMDFYHLFGKYSLEKRPVSRLFIRSKEKKCSGLVSCSPANIMFINKFKRTFVSHFQLVGMLITYFLVLLQFRPSSTPPQCDCTSWLANFTLQ